MRGPHMFRFDEGHQFATDGGPDQSEPNRRWWVAAAALGAVIYLCTFLLVAIIYWRF